MALKLDELLTKKKEPVQILDLSKSSANTKEEFKKLLEKVPEFKIKMEKVRPEDVKIRDKKYSFGTTKKELKPKSFPFANPVPSEMKCLRLDDLCSVGIQWRMLTSIRPKNKLDEEYYSKLIELGKLQTASREKEKKTPLCTFLRKTKTRSGVLESCFLSCRHCGEEFCSAETCSVFAYDCYERTINTSQDEELAAQDAADNAEEKKRKRRKSTAKKTFFRPRKRKVTKSKMSTTVSHETKVKAPAKAKTVVNKIRQFQKLNRISYARNSTKNTAVKPVSTRKSNAKRSTKSTKINKKK